MEGFIHTDDDVRLRYAGHRSGRPVVFVHGWVGTAEQWRPAAQALAGECRVVVYDQRGHPRSQDARSGWTVHRLADDLAQLLEKLGATDAELRRLCYSLADPESRADTVRAIVAGMVTRSAPPELTEPSWSRAARAWSPGPPPSGSRRDPGRAA